MRESELKRIIFEETSQKDDYNEKSVFCRESLGRARYLSARLSTFSANNLEELAKTDGGCGAQAGARIRRAYLKFIIFINFGSQRAPKIIRQRKIKIDDNAAPLRRGRGARAKGGTTESTEAGCVFYARVSLYMHENEINNLKYF